MSTSPWFWNRIARRYARSPVSDETSYQVKLDKTREYFRPGMNVLEIGCGTGTTALYHAPAVGRIHAIDFSERMIAIARDKQQRQGIKNVEFEQARVEDLAADGPGYDAVMAHSIIHLVEDRLELLRSVHDCLKPGGVFISSTPCIGDEMKFMKWLFPIGTFLRVLPTIRVFTANELVWSMNFAGFDIDHRWQPGEGKALFVVAIKSGNGGEAS